MESKKSRAITTSALVALIAIFILCAYDFYRKTKTVNYPDSECVFKKYYDADSVLKAVCVSDDAITDILSWYESRFAEYTVTENQQRGDCVVTNWKMPTQTVNLVICDHQKFRTILSKTFFK